MANCNAFCEIMTSGNSTSSAQCNSFCKSKTGGAPSAPGVSAGCTITSHPIQYFLPYLYSFEGTACYTSGGVQNADLSGLNATGVSLMNILFDNYSNLCLHGQVMGFVPSLCFQPVKGTTACTQTECGSLCANLNTPPVFLY